MSTIRAWSALAVVAITLPAVAADLHVPGDHRTIQGAIDAAAPHDTVIVADGIWTGAGNVDLNYGGKAIVVRSANGPSNCIIDCNATPEHPARGVNFVSGETAAAVFEGFTIRNGATPPGAIADLFNGAAILCNNGSSPTIRNCVCRDNHAGCWGGAICCTNASPTIVGCVLIDNLVDDDGGGLFAWGQSSPTVVNTLITGNHSLITAGGIADFCFGNDFGFTLVNCTVTGNTAEWQGGGGQMFGS
ncbi:MAG: right-handed parallel beta-helix repeat-containing protein, partial [Phycisphaerales bacterium]|nr:right-handed parallel beta-helix repeat-containing protein [Phycisphaerales bacterium]